MDEADKRLGKPQNHTQTVIYKFQLPIPCLDLLAGSQARQAKFQIISHRRLATPERGISRILEMRFLNRVCL